MLNFQLNVILDKGVWRKELSYIVQKPFSEKIQIFFLHIFAIGTSNYNTLRTNEAYRFNLTLIYEYFLTLELQQHW